MVESFRGLYSTVGVDAKPVFEALDNRNPEGFMADQCGRQQLRVETT